MTTSTLHYRRQSSHHAGAEAAFPFVTRGLNPLRPSYELTPAPCHDSGAPRIYLVAPGRENPLSTVL